MHEQPYEKNPNQTETDFVAADTETTAEVNQVYFPRIYVASLSDYNNGLLHGEWLAADRDADEIYADIATMLAASPDPSAEEFAIHDYENFGPAKIDEYDGIERVSRIAKGIAVHGPAFGAWADFHDGESELLDKFDSAYLGHYESLTEYAEQLIDDLGYHELLDKSVPASLRPYARIDTEALARDMYLEGDIHIYPDEESGGIWLFDDRD